ncbi:vigilin isoform X3 [Lepeophtheirus salmonis]|uniref:vigilin isoform X3 n=1 Tax=Lepeophtheirus salmonis TaxID=72036 RepID=UPI003AF38D0F
MPMLRRVPTRTMTCFPRCPQARPVATLGIPSESGTRSPNYLPRRLRSQCYDFQVFRVPTEERKEMGGGFGGDESLKILKLVTASSNAKVEMSSAKDQSLTFLITGKPNTVAKAKRELLVNFQTQLSQTISIPKSHHKAILGKGGAKKVEMEERTSTRIKVPLVNENSDVIVVSGTKEGIDRAFQEIKLISDEQMKHAVEVLSIPKIYHPFIHGPNGETVKALATKYPNVRVNIPHPSVMKDDIYVAGDREGVVAICLAIDQIYKDIEKKAATVSVEVRKPQHKYIFGPKGQTLNDILAETGVFVEVPPTDSQSDTITLRGPQDKLGTALNKVYEKANSVITHHLNCPSWLHKYIIGRKGSSIQKLKVDLPKVHVEFVDSMEQIKIEGPPEEADKAKEILNIQVQHLINTMSYADVNVDSKYHKYIIGKGGATVNKLKGELDVTINIPDEEGASIRIEGNKEGVAKAEKDLRHMVSKMENEKEEDLIIESRFHRLLIGPKGERIQRIRADFHQVQIIFPDLGDSSELVKVRGPKDDVDKVCLVLDKFHKELLETSYQVRVPMFKEFHKYVIGKGGTTVRKIRAETETRVDIPVPGSDSDVITLTGRKSNVEKAYQLLLKLQSEIENIIVSEVAIPPKIHNTVIGAGGKLIQSIMDDCGGVSVVFPPFDSGSDKVVIRGPKEDVEKAKKMLLDLSSEKQLSSISDEIRANPSHHKFLIGRAGVNIQGIRDRTGARIIFPNDKDGDKEVITILGTKEAVAAAKKELEKKVKDLDNVVEDSMIVEPKFHRYFVARRGEVLRNIGDEFGGVIVSFPRSGVISDKVTLKGAKDCVEAARNRINEIVMDLESEVTIECAIPQAHHRTVMGPRGSKIQKVCQDFHVQVKFPEKTDHMESTHENSDVIRITGKSENCVEAAEALKQLVPITIQVDVPFEFHRYVIGQKGTGVRQLMSDNDVNIIVPPSDKHSDCITVVGTLVNVEKARESIRQRVEEFEKEKLDKMLKSFEIIINIKPEFHPKIIGRKGSVIQQLRSEHDVNIQLPKKDSSECDVITITGYEDRVNMAKDAILKIVHDIESMIKEGVNVDHRVHPKIIGRRGVGIRKIMSDFRVDIKLPRDGDVDRNQVVVIGKENDVLDCKDHLLNLEEEYLQDIQENDWMEEYIKPVSVDSMPDTPKPSRGFEVAKGAPWHGVSDEAFPTLSGNNGMAVPVAPVWGPKRL